MYPWTQHIAMEIVWMGLIQTQSYRQNLISDSSFGSWPKLKGDRKVWLFHKNVFCTTEEMTCARTSIMLDRVEPACFRMIFAEISHWKALIFPRGKLAQFNRARASVFFEIWYCHWWVWSLDSEIWVSPSRVRLPTCTVHDASLCMTSSCVSQSVDDEIALTSPEWSSLNPCTIKAWRIYISTWQCEQSEPVQANDG